MMGDFEGLADVVRSAAIAAGVSPGDLDAPPKCFGGCGSEVARVGITCRTCQEERSAEGFREALRDAWNTVPTSLRWASFRHQSLSKWVTDSKAIERVKDIARDLHANPRVTLVGPQGAGKTSLACILLRHWISLGSKPESKPADKWRARRARFAVAGDLIADREVSPLGAHIVSVDLAYQASVLVLDEVGRGKDPFQVIFRLVHERHRENRPTIVTTPHATVAKFVAATSDGGLARRIFDDATVVEVKKCST